MARLNSELIVSLTDNASGKARGLDASLSKLENRHRSAGAAIRQQNRLTAESATAMGQTSRMAIAGATRAIAPLATAYTAGNVVSSAADFETALSEIQKKAGATREQTAAMGKDILDLATSGDLAVPIEEIAAAFERGAAAGLPVEDLRQFAVLSAKAADGFGMSAEEVGNFNAKLKVGMKMTDEQVRNIFDQVNALGDAGIADERHLVDYMDRVGASLKTLGLNGGQSLALGATMLNLGMTSEVAATGTDALANKLLTVSRLTGGKRKTFEKYMGSVEDFADLVDKDANGALQGMLEKLTKLNSRDRMAFLTDFMGQEHAGKILRIAEALDELRKNNELAADSSRWMGSLDKAYALKLDTFWARWQVVKNQMEKLGIDLGNAAMPGLKAGLEGMRNLFDQASEGVERFQATLDTNEIDKAKQAIGDLGTALTDFMGIKTDKSPLSDFGAEAAREANRLARTVNKFNEVIDAYQRANDSDPSNDPARGTNLLSGLAEVGSIALGRDEAEARGKDGGTTQSVPAGSGRGGRVSSQPMPDIDPDRFGGHSRLPESGPIPASRPLDAAALGEALSSVTMATRPTGTQQVQVVNPVRPNVNINMPITINEATDANKVMQLIGQGVKNAAESSFSEYDGGL